MTTELQTTEQTAQALIQRLTLNKNTGTALETLLKLPLLDADNKIPAGVLRIVGALSDGAVIESGDNANGNYVRFADGTQVCFIRKELIGVNCTVSAGIPMHCATLGTFDYPALFSEYPIVVGSIVENDNNVSRGYMTFGSVETDALLSQTPMLALYRPNSATNMSIRICVLAIGCWK